MIVYKPLHVQNDVYTCVIHISYQLTRQKPYIKCYKQDISFINELLVCIITLYVWFLTYRWYILIQKEPFFWKRMVMDEIHHWTQKKLRFWMRIKNAFWKKKRFEHRPAVIGVLSGSGLCITVINKTTDTSNNNSERLQTLRVRIRWARMYLYSLSKDPVTFYQTYIDLFRLSAAHIMCFDWIGIDIWEVSCNWEHITWS